MGKGACGFGAAILTRRTRARSSAIMESAKANKGVRRGMRSRCPCWRKSTTETSDAMSPCNEPRRRSRPLPRHRKGRKCRRECGRNGCARVVLLPIASNWPWFEAQGGRKSLRVVVQTGGVVGVNRKRCRAKRNRDKAKAATGAIEKAARKRRRERNEQVGVRQGSKKAVEDAFARLAENGAILEKGAMGCFCCALGW